MAASAHRSIGTFSTMDASSTTSACKTLGFQELTGQLPEQGARRPAGSRERTCHLRKGARSGQIAKAKRRHERQRVKSFLIQFEAGTVNISQVILIVLLKTQREDLLAQAEGEIAQSDPGLQGARRRLATAAPTANYSPPRRFNIYRHRARTRICPCLARSLGATAMSVSLGPSFPTISVLRVSSFEAIDSFHVRRCASAARACP